MGGMSRWLGRRSVRLSAFISWSVAVVAAAVLADSWVVVGAVIGVGYCAGLAYFAASRRWWSVTGLVIAAVCPVVIGVTMGSGHSVLERRVGFAATVVLILCSMIAMRAGGRQGRLSSGGQSGG